MGARCFALRFQWYAIAQFTRMALRVLFRGVAEPLEAATIDTSALTLVVESGLFLSWQMAQFNTAHLGQIRLTLSGGVV